MNMKYETTYNNVLLLHDLLVIMLNFSFFHHFMMILYLLNLIIGCSMEQILALYFLVIVRSKLGTIHYSYLLSMLLIKISKQIKNIFNTMNFNIMLI